MIAGAGCTPSACAPGCPLAGIHCYLTDKQTYHPISITMKTLMTLVAVASVALSAASAFGAEKCADCAKCCKEKAGTCTKSCCKK